MFALVGAPQQTTTAVVLAPGETDAPGVTRATDPITTSGTTVTIPGAALTYISLLFTYSKQVKVYRFKCILRLLVTF